MNLIKKSLDFTNKNLIILVPFLLQFVFSFLLIVVMSVATVFLLSGEVTIESEVGGYIAIIGGVIVFILVGILIQGYVISGVVGMAKEAVEVGETNLKTFFEFAKKYFIRVFLLELIGVMLSILTMLPALAYLLKSFENIPESEVSFLPLGFFLVYIPLAIISGFIYFVVHFSIIPLIMDEKSVIGAIRSSLKMLFKGSKDCLVLFGITLLLVVGLFAISLIPLIGQLVVPVAQLYLTAVFFLWSVLFYEKYKSNELEKG